MKNYLSYIFKCLKLRRNIVKYKIGNVKYNNSLIDSLVPQLIEIGDNFISAPGSVILSHDASLLVHFNQYRVEKTVIGNNVFLGANAVVLAGVKIGDGAIIGAGSIVTKDVTENSVVAGNPARHISTVKEYHQKCIDKSVLLTAPDCFQKLFKNEKLSEQEIASFQKLAQNKTDESN